MVKEDREHVAVTVWRNGESVVTIETNCCGGRTLLPGDEEAIRDAARTLLGFVGGDNLERDEARRQRDALLVAIKPLLFAPATTRERRLMDIAQAAIAFAEGAAPLPREIGAKL